MKLLSQLFVLLLLCNTVFAQETERQSLYNLNKENIAIDGYDPVSYFDGEPKEGFKKHASIYEGVSYFFFTEANKNKFIEEPEKYEPQYGGWCAYAMGKNGNKVEVDVETYKIIDGKLYLFYNRLFTNTLNDWNKDEVNLQKRADKFWDEHRK